MGARLLAVVLQLVLTDVLLQVDRCSSTRKSIVAIKLEKYVHLTRQTNAFTEVLFDDALQRARKLDHHFHETGRVVGPLHGIPITLKDQFNIKGVDTTLGYVGRAFMPAVEDAVLVSILQDLGGVIIAKTNLPQSIMVQITPTVTSANDLQNPGSGAKPKILSGA